MTGHIKLEVGKTYIDRNGDHHTITCIGNGWAIGADGKSWRADSGMYCLSADQCDDDLIAEAREQEPTSRACDDMTGHDMTDVVGSFTVAMKRCEAPTMRLRVYSETQDGPRKVQQAWQVYDSEHVSIEWRDLPLVIGDERL